MRFVKTAIVSTGALAALVVAASGASAFRGDPPQLDVVNESSVTVPSRQVAELSDAYSTAVAQVADCVRAIDPLPDGVTAIEVVVGSRSADGFQIPLSYRSVHDEHSAPRDVASPNTEHQALLGACEASSGYAEASSRYHDAFVQDAHSVAGSIETLAECMREAGAWTSSTADSASFGNVRPLVAEYIDKHGVTDSIQQCAAKSPGVFAVADR